MNPFYVTASSSSFLHNLVTTGKIRSKLVSMAAGFVVANNAPLAPVSHQYFSGYLTEGYGEELMAYLNTLQSGAPVDYKEIQRLACAFYEIRCRIALGGFKPASTGSNGVYNVYHIGEGLNGEEITLLRDNGPAFAAHCAGFEHIFNSVIHDLKRSDQS